MSTATRPEAPRARPRDVEMVTTLALGPGGLGAFLDLVPEPPGRLRYRDGSLTIVSPTFAHEVGVRRIDELVKVLDEECGLELVAAGSTLYHREDLGKGIMPDASYYIAPGDSLAGVRDAIDLGRYPPPDLIVEVAWTHGAAASLELCRAMNIPEAWVYDLPNSGLRFFHFGPDGHYVERPTSRAFPRLNSGEAAALLGSIPHLEPTLRTRRRLRTWARDHLGPPRERT